MKSKESNKFLEISGTCEGKTETLMIPISLHDDFHKCLDTSEGMSILSILFDEYEALSELQRGAFQTVVVNFCDDIVDIQDMVHLLRATKRVLIRNGW